MPFRDAELLDTYYSGMLHYLIESFRDAALLDMTVQGCCIT
jgi:hypothetical protein